MQDVSTRRLPSTTAGGMLLLAQLFYTTCYRSVDIPTTYLGYQSPLLFSKWTLLLHRHAAVYPARTNKGKAYSNSNKALQVQHSVGLCTGFYAVLVFNAEWSIDFQPSVMPSNVSPLFYSTLFL